MGTSWLVYSQCILDKVSFDRTLFRKELRKFLQLLSPIDRIKLLRWCRLCKTKRLYSFTMGAGQLKIVGSPLRNVFSRTKSES